MSPALPAPAFRIAVTGARTIDAGALERIEAQLGEVIGTVARRLDAAGGERPWLRLISPLGEGADRMFARAGLSVAAAPAGCRIGLEVPLPFRAERYERTFGADPAGNAASVADFRDLLAAAGEAVLTLDGGAEPDDARQRSYEALGQFLVRHADLLVAVWDEGRTPGRGGTADTVRFALASGVPVWWVHAREDRPPRWLAELSDLEEPGEPAAAAPCLARHIDRLLTPPAGHHHHGGGLVGALRRRLRVPATPLATFLGERSADNPAIALVHRRAVGLLRRIGARAMQRRQGSPPPAVADAPGPVAPDAPAIVAAAAALSRKYQDRYRSSYMAILMLGAVALIAAILALTRKSLVDVLIWVELASLLLIAVLWLANEVFEWHARYLDYRVLAELGRCHHFLCAIGRGSPLPLAASRGGVPESWPAWLFAAQVRATPLPCGLMDGGRVADLKLWVRARLFGRQLRFHRRRWLECRGAEQLLGRIGVALFVGTFAVVAVKGGLHLAHVLPKVQSVLGVFAALLPGLSAATFGIRSYEGFGSLAEQSERMIATIEGIAPRFDRIVPDAPLALRQIGVETAAVTGAMLDDVTGWSQLFRSKTIEA